VVALLAKEVRVAAREVEPVVIVVVDGAARMAQQTALALRPAI